MLKPDTDLSDLATLLNKIRSATPKAPAVMLQAYIPLGKNTPAIRYTVGITSDITLIYL
jgi:hypothetical protein